MAYTVAAIADYFIWLANETVISNDTRRVTKNGAT